MKWWSALSGKKSAIGGYFLLAAWGISEFVIGDWGVSADILPKIAGTFTKIGVLLTGTGLGHKGIKAIKKKMIV